jgi:serine/threonine protein kinase
MQNMIGKTISHYRIIEKLGEGGMGVIFKAEDTKLKRFVALKFLPPALTLDKEARDRFIYEAQAASGLDHPNICTIYEIDETAEGQMFMAMAYYEGETLQKKVASNQLSVNSIMDSDSNRTGFGKSPPTRHRSSRCQTVKYHRDKGRCGQDSRLWPGEAFRRDPSYENRFDDGNGGLHVAGTNLG